MVILMMPERKRFFPVDVFPYWVTNNSAISIPMGCPWLEGAGEQIWKANLERQGSTVGREKKGPDQKILKKHVWPWAKLDSMQHGSYKCAQYPGTIGFPTRREKKPGNYIASNNDIIWRECPEICRRHQNWTHC